MIILALLATLIGLSLGLLGGGGSILAVPVLAYAAHLDAKAAIATSLLVVGTTALVGTVQHARRGNVAWRTGAVFAVAAMGGAYGGGFAAAWFSGTTLLLLFAGMMVVTAVAMVRGRGPTRGPKREHLPVSLVVLDGLVVGAATGLVGAGGGFLVVPALVLLAGMDMHRAVGTSLMVIAFKSFAAFAGHAAHVEIDVAVAAVVTGGAVAGSLVGGRVAHRVPQQVLRKAFAGLVLLMAGYVIWREAGLGYAVATGVVAGVLIAAVGVRERQRAAPTSVMERRPAS